VQGNRKPADCATGITRIVGGQMQSSGLHHRDCAGSTTKEEQGPVRTLLFFLTRRRKEYL
jgi:hypothetical protein